MYLKRDVFGHRGEATSLVILVSMIVITLGILTGGRILEQRIKTSSKASTSSISCASLTRSSNQNVFELVVTAAQTQTNFYAILQRDGVTYWQGMSTDPTTITFPIANPVAGTYKAFVASTSNGYYIGSSTCTYTYTLGNISLTATPTPLPYTVSGYIRFNNGIGAENIVVKLFVYGSGSSPPRTFHSQAITNQEGKYQFHLLPGTYDIEPQSTAAVPISPVMQTTVLMAAPYTVTIPLFTAGGSPTSTPTMTPTVTSTTTPTATPSDTPIPTLTHTQSPTPTITGTAPSATVTLSPTVTPTSTPTVSVSPPISLTPTTSIAASPSPTPSVTKIPVYCAKKNIGDADCNKDKLGNAINILDYAIWYSEFINQCSLATLNKCGKDVDGDGNAMDANFNYIGTNYIKTDIKVDIFDYAVWIQGLTAGNDL